MKVHLKVTVVDRILTDLHKAYGTRRQVDVIEVSHTEYLELREDPRSDEYLDMGYHSLAAYSEKFSATSFKKYAIENIQDRNYAGQRRWVACDMVKFRGVPLVVVPDGWRIV